MCQRVKVNPKSALLPAQSLASTSCFLLAVKLWDDHLGRAAVHVLLFKNVKTEWLCENKSYFVINMMRSVS